jgi:orotidine-5'-phosphate decarboxylase
MTSSDAKSSSRIIVALDYSSAKEALHLVDQISPHLCRLKVGKELFTIAGPDFVRQLIARGFDVFLDLKFHDIPTTVAKACVAAADLGVWMINIHCLGGREMMELAARTMKERRYSTHLIGVTLLTSMDSKACEEVGLPGAIESEIERLAILAKESGLDGVVCSAQEAALLRKRCGQDFLLVTPGIRNSEMPADDQHRTMSPEAALAAGSDYLVIGRMITGHPQPLEKLNQLHSLLAKHA